MTLAYIKEQLAEPGEHRWQLLTKLPHEADLNGTGYIDYNGQSVKDSQNEHDEFSEATML